jgi:hypothetical protein
MSNKTTNVFLTDGYTDRAQPGTRAALVEERNRLRMLSWADPGDQELRAEVEKLEHQLRALDQNEKTNK